MVSFDLIRVTAVRYLRDHVLWLRFSDGLEGELDLSRELRGPVFEPLRDPEFFARVTLGEETISWPNGADWAPETLHEHVAAANGIATKGIGTGAASGDVQRAEMPEISRFFGIVIAMYYVDHARPHFHARYGGQLISMEIDGDGVNGSFPPHRLTLLYEWRERHKAELRENWNRLRRGELPLPIPPLD